MPTKGDRTREMIIHEAATLLNTQGVAGTSIADIVGRTGIQKGGLYRHFESKEALAEQAFAYAVAQRVAAMEQAITAASSTRERLMAVARTFPALLEPSALPGGCPLMNMAIEVDAFDLPLKVQAQVGMERLRSAIRQIVQQGKANGELPLYVNGNAVATILIATCEGALMLSQLYEDPIHLHRALDHLQAYFETLTP